MKQGERKIVLRCAVYTRVSTDSGLEQNFNSLTISERLPMPTLRAKHMRGGSLSESDMTTGDFRGVRGSGRRSRSCWTMFRPAGSTSSSSTRSIG